MKLLLRSVMAAVLLGPQTPGAPAPATPSAAKAAFERFKALEGDWEATSTKGWTEQVHFTIVAARSAAMETSFGAHPDETMTTMFHLDGDRLLLTHYCVAKNQPRLEATTFENAGKTITFTFLDATNLPSHDHGHMDKVVYKFIDPNHFSSQWTWFQNGKEQWMEDVTATRKATPAR